MRLLFLAALAGSGSEAVAQSGARVRFVDVTQQSGIRFQHPSAPEKKYIVESMSGGVLLFDFDDDGWLDIYFVNSLTVQSASQPQALKSHLYRNLHDGTFDEVAESAGVAAPGWGMGGCVADYDADGMLDFYITSFGPNRLYRNKGRSVFEDVAPGLGLDDPRYSSGCGFADYDNDGDLDLFVANYVGFRLDDLPEFGKGRFCRYQGIPVQCGPRGLPGAADALFRQEPGGRFSEVSKEAGVADPQGRYGLGVAWTDLDQDGWPDLFVANDAGPNFLYRNKADGTFEEIGYLSGTALGDDGREQGSMGVAVGDYNRDGWLDLYVTNFSREHNALYRRDAQLLFTDVASPAGTSSASLALVGWGTGFIDFDNDGWLDILAVNGHVYPQVEGTSAGTSYAQPILAYRNNADGIFSEVSAQLGQPLTKPGVSRGAAFGDLDNDGDLDVVVTDLDGAARVLRNEGGNAANWLRVRLRGKGGNRFALGAQVRVQCGGLLQLAEVRSGSSYLSQDDFRLHFGMGKCRQAESVQVRWPAGGASRLENVPVNQEVLILQEKVSRQDAKTQEPQ